MKFWRRIFGGLEKTLSQTAKEPEKDDVVRAWTLHQRHCHYSGRPQFWC